MKGDRKIKKSFEGRVTKGLHQGGHNYLDIVDGMIKFDKRRNDQRGAITRKSQIVP